MGAVIAKLQNSKPDDRRFQAVDRQAKNKQGRPLPSFGPGSRRSSYYSSRAAAARSACRKSSGTENPETEASHFGEAGPIDPSTSRRLARLPTIESVDGN